jgi:hypothetical protein
MKMNACGQTKYVMKHAAEVALSRKSGSDETEDDLNRNDQTHTVRRPGEGEFQRHVKEFCGHTGVDSVHHDHVDHRFSPTRV